MAPTKRKNDGKADIASKNLKLTRATRRSTRQASHGAAKVVLEAAPKIKKAKLSSKEKPDTKAKPGSKDKRQPKPKTTDEAAAAEDPPSNGVNGSKTIVIERCKQCTQLKKWAAKVKLGLETAVSGINVLVNPEKMKHIKTSSIPCSISESNSNSKSVDLDSTSGTMNWQKDLVKAIHELVSFYELRFNHVVKLEDNLFKSKKTAQIFLLQQDRKERLRMIQEIIAADITAKN
ncbi:uncharacterized protein LOC111917287 isoform X2 [Lactuca sativa]|uniref:uncharacterized protein LOC111917287 isoform X2 n=1 Tax=Lactuca sativa TaxID=4236 RepID=UPI001C69310A|nr:uncharacterized protein LOC111917287 isoform X2 [Lactuca sativa]